MSEMTYTRCTLCNGTQRMIHAPDMACLCIRSKTPGWDATGVTLAQLDRLVESRKSLEDYAAVVRLLLAGTLRWEPFAGAGQVGELCFDGLRYVTTLDNFGVPQLTDGLRVAIDRVTRRPARKGAPA